MRLQFLQNNIQGNLPIIHFSPLQFTPVTSHMVFSIMTSTSLHFMHNLSRLKDTRRTSAEAKWTVMLSGEAIHHGTLLRWSADWQPIIQFE